jgi:hypothetical protein
MKAVWPDARGDSDDIGVRRLLPTRAADKKCKMQNAECKQN